MKKWMSILVAVLMVFTMVPASANVLSKTTTNATAVVSVATSTDVAVAEDFAIAISEDHETVAREIEKISTFVSEGSAPVEYFPEAVVEQVTQALAAVTAAAAESVDVSGLEINEFVTVEEIAYDDTYGDVTADFSFTTAYTPDQILIVLLGTYSGEIDETTGEYVVEWTVLEAVANEDGTVSVTFTQEAMLKIQQAQSTAMAVVSTPVAPTV